MTRVQSEIELDGRNDRCPCELCEDEHCEPPCLGQRVGGSRNLFLKVLYDICPRIDSVLSGLQGSSRSSPGGNQYSSDS